MEYMNYRVEKIAILVWALTAGGAERAAGYLSKELSKSFEVFLFIRNRKVITYEYAGTIVEIDSDNDEDYVNAIREAKMMHRIDVSISFLDYMNYVNVLSRDKDKVIVSERSVISYIVPKQYKRLLWAKTVYPFADAIVCVSKGVEFDVKNIIDYRPLRITSIYNFVDKSKIQNLGKRKALSNKKNIICSIGRHETHKNHFRLIRQFSILQKRIQNCELWIIGDGPLKEKISAFCVEVGLELDRDVKFIPYCDNPFYFLAQADILAVTSRYEGLPNVILEAMSLQVPVVSVDCIAGPRELLDDNSDYSNKISGVCLGKRGLLVENADSDDDGNTSYFADAMFQLLSEEDLKLEIKKNQKKYIDAYDNEEIAEQWKQIIYDVMNSEYKPAVIPLNKEVYIFGAGNNARITLKRCAEKGINVEAFTVTELTCNATDLLGLPIVSVNSLLGKRDEITIIIGVGLDYMDEVIEMLEMKGFSDVRFLT